MADFERIQDPAITEHLAELIAAHHFHLRGARVALVWDVRPTKRRAQQRVILGSARCLSGAVKAIVDADFMITLTEGWWNTATEQQRTALLDHELCHCGMTPRGKWTGVPHEIEDFVVIIERHGFANSHKQLAEAVQLHLPFGGAEAAG